MIGIVRQESLLWVQVDNMFRILNYIFIARLSWKQKEWEIIG